jgi:peptidase M50B-like protein
MLKTQQGFLFVSTLLLCWLLMQIVHELGHMTAAWVTGGRVTHVVLHPLAISRTDVNPNPHPLVVAWGGPIIGAALPVAIWLLSKLVRRQMRFLQFFAGFCLVANGAYIGIGSFQRIGDCNELLRDGSPMWTLCLFGAIATVLGLWLWKSTPSFFDAEQEGSQVLRSAMVTTVALIVVAFLEIVVRPR